MNLRKLFGRTPSAGVARERLQILLAHERASAGRADLIATLQTEILEAIARHIPIDRDKVVVKLEAGADVSTLAIDVEVPQAALAG